MGEIGSGQAPHKPAGCIKNTVVVYRQEVVVMLLCQRTTSYQAATTTKIKQETCFVLDLLGDYWFFSARRGTEIQSPPQCGYFHVLAHQPSLIESGVLEQEIHQTVQESFPPGSEFPTPVLSRHKDV